MGVRFEPEGHRYFLNDAELPSVTTVLRAVGLLNFGGASDSAMAMGRDRGDRVHLATELNDRGELDESSIDFEIAGYLAAWRRFVDEWNFKCHEIEVLLHHPIYRYAGRADRFGSARLPGKRVSRDDIVLDIKTGTPQRATGYQLAAYNACLVRAQRKRIGVYLLPDGSYRAQPYDHPGDLSVFLSALCVFNARKECKA